MSSVTETVVAISPSFFKFIDYEFPWQIGSKRGVAVVVVVVEHNDNENYKMMFCPPPLHPDICGHY